MKNPLVAAYLKLLLQNAKVSEKVQEVHPRQILKTQNDAELIYDFRYNIWKIHTKKDDAIYFLNYDEDVFEQQLKLMLA